MIFCRFKRSKSTPEGGVRKRRREPSPAKTKTGSERPADDLRANPLVRRVLMPSGTRAGAPQRDTVEKAEAKPADTEPADSGPAQAEPTNSGPEHLVREDSVRPVHACSSGVVVTVLDSLQSTERIQPPPQDHKAASSNSDEILSYIDAPGSNSRAAAGKTEPCVARSAQEVIQADDSDTDVEVVGSESKDDSADRLTSATPLQLSLGGRRVPCFTEQDVHTGRDSQDAVAPSFVAGGVPATPRPDTPRCAHATQLSTSYRCRLSEKYQEVVEERRRQDSRGPRAVTGGVLHESGADFPHRDAVAGWVLLAPGACACAPAAPCMVVCLLPLPPGACRTPPRPSVGARLRQTAHAGHRMQGNIINPAMHALHTRLSEERAARTFCFTTFFFAKIIEGTPLARALEQSATAIGGRVRQRHFQYQVADIFASTPPVQSACPSVCPSAPMCCTPAADGAPPT